MFRVLKLASLSTNFAPTSQGTLSNPPAKAHDFIWFHGLLECYVWVSVWFAEFWLRIALLCFVLNNTSAVDIMIISSTTWNVGLLNLAICVGDVHSRNSFVDGKNTICHKTNIKNSASAIFHTPRSLFVASRVLRNSSQPFLGYMLHSSCELVPGCNKFKTRMKSRPL